MLSIVINKKLKISVGVSIQNPSTNLLCSLQFIWFFYLNKFFLLMWEETAVNSDFLTWWKKNGVAWKASIKGTISRGGWLGKNNKMDTQAKYQILTGSVLG